MQPKPWYTPFWFIICILFVACLQSLVLFTVTAKYAAIKVTGLLLFNALFWPALLLVEAIVYWVIKRKITERKWVWAHLLFSLFAFVLLMILRLVVSFLALTHNPVDVNASMRLMNTIEGYCFWAGVSIGHAFFIVAIVRSCSAKQTLQPADDNDILSELPG